MDFRAWDDVVKAYLATKNKAKIEGVVLALREMGLNWELKTVEFNLDATPTSLEETIELAIKRAEYAFKNDGVGIGIEAGFFLTRWGWLGVHAAVLYDGRKNYVGLSSAFQIDREIVEAIARRGSAALEDMGTDAYKGIVYVLMGGRKSRVDLVFEAFYNALAMYLSSA